MLYLVVERFRRGPQPVHDRTAVSGRMFPEGLKYIDSWLVNDDRLDCCFLLIETDDPGLIDVWCSHWHDLAEFQVYPFTDRADAERRVNGNGRVSASGDRMSGS